MRVIQSINEENLCELQLRKLSSFNLMLIILDSNDSNQETEIIF